MLFIQKFIPSKLPIVKVGVGNVRNAVNGPGT